MVSFMLYLSCTDTIAIIKRKLSRKNTIGHSYEIIIINSLKVINMNVKKWNRKKRKGKS
jgi:hypothetical protein